MAGELRGVRTKIDRAIKHRKDLQDSVQEFCASDFFEIKTELGYKRRVVGRAVNVKLPGPEVGSLIGECVLCLRSALDQLAFQLAKSNSKPLPQKLARASAFPIFRSGPAFRGERGRGAAPKIAGVSPAAKRCIEEVQPYHRRRQPLLWSLWQLEELANLDKHREIPLTGAMPALGPVAIKFNRPGVTRFGFRPIPGPIEERRRVVYVLEEDISKPDDITVDWQVKSAVHFDRRADPSCVRGWPVPVVIDGIFFTLSVLLLPAFGPELQERFGEVVGIRIEENGGPKEPGQGGSSSLQLPNPAV
jgi:hypothetical protein